MSIRSIAALIALGLFQSTLILPLPIIAQTTSPVAKPATYLLKYKLRAGETLVSKVTHFAETRTKMGEHMESSSSRTTSEKIWQVQSVDDKGNMTFEYSLRHVVLAQRVGDKDEFKYDSQTDATPPDIFKKVAESIGQPLAVITINTRGQVVKRDKEMKTPQLGIGDLTIALPADAIAIGAEWSVPREIRVKLDDGSYKTVKVRELYTLQKVSAGLASISIETQPLTPVDDPAVESQLIQQLSRGQIKFDLDKGRVVNKQLDWKEESVGFRGDNTSLKYDAQYVEELITDPAQTAAKKVKSIVQ
jgi:hypothetical protein